MWILISKTLYDANKTISEFAPGTSGDPDKMYWYNTETKEVLPGNEIPQTGVVDGIAVDESALGKRKDISRCNIAIWHYL